MDTLTLKVEAVAGTMKSFKGSNGNWYKRGKNAKFADFSSLRKGQEVILTAQGEWVSDFTTTGVSNGGVSQTSNNGSSTTGSTRTSNNNSNGDTISRQSAVKSVLGSPVVVEMLKNAEVTSSEQAIEIVDNLINKYYTYITTGLFTKENVTTPTEALKEIASV